ncbi:hypothetical protein ACOMHN_043812 [Nucella lapillus]
MGDNLALRLTSRMTPCPAEGGGEYLTSGGQGNVTRATHRHQHHHHHHHHPPPPHPLTKGVLTLKGPSPFAGPSGSPDEGDPSSPCQGEGSQHVSARLDKPVDEREPSMHCVAGGSGPHTDLPADCCPAGGLTEAGTRLEEGLKQHQYHTQEGGSGLLTADEPSMQSPAIATPISVVSDCSHGLPEPIQNLWKLTSLPHRLQNGRVPDTNSPFSSANDATLIESRDNASETPADFQTRFFQENGDQKSPAHVTISMETEQNILEDVDTHLTRKEIHIDRLREGHNQTHKEGDKEEEEGEKTDRLKEEEEEDEEEEEEETDSLKEEDEEDEEEEEEENDLDDEDEGEESEPRVHVARDVDEGWAWVVLAAAFMGMCIFGTFTFSIGIFQAEILQTLEPDIQKTSWVGATHFSTLCIMGPFAGLIRNRLGSRLTVLMSSVIICCGMVAASLSVNVTQLILTYGVITGMGTGMALNPMFVSVTFYFERYRGFASGVIAAGSGAGMFIGAPVIRQLIETYGLHGTFLLWGAVGLNIGVVGMVMTPSSLETSAKTGGREVEVAGEEEGLKRRRRRVGRVDSALLASVTTLPSAGGYWGSVLGLSSLRVCDMDGVVEEAGGTYQTALPPALRQSQNLLEVPDLNDAIRSYSELSSLSPEAMETAIRTTWLTRNFRSSQLSMGDSLDSVSTGKRRYSPWLFRKNGPLPDADKEEEGEECSPHEEHRLAQVPQGRRSRLAGLDVFHILSNPGFALYMFSASVWVFGESIVFSYLPTYAETQGSTPFQAAILLTALGLTSTFSRLIVGFVASQPSVGPDLMHVGLLGLCGLFTLTFPLYSSTFSGQLVFAALYGLYSGGLASVINILIISLTGVHYIALGFGLLYFGQGLASLAGPPISGFSMVLFKPSPPPSAPPPSPSAPGEKPDVAKAGEATPPPVRIRMKGDSSYV